MVNMLMSKALVIIGLVAVVVMAFSWNPMNGLQKVSAPRTPKPAPAGSKTLVVAGGCFWCVESQMDQLRGVYFAESGYAGGQHPGVDYEEVCSGQTGHAEAVRVVFDPKVISEADLLRIFFTIHNPTTLNQQGPDHGTQYRSAIFYSSPEEKELAIKIRDEIAKAKLWKNPIVTSIEPLKNYTPAEEYHQNYFEKYEKATDAQRMTMNAGYCAAIVEPHVIEFRHKFADRLKKQ
ncbi:peptide-methionine (S)-S-oxide reductase MsrA [Fimbriimonas ginsengisoli]|uniref:Peptide methionine sulfoxide reductase MsrA n=1 Tax=Fimbriimonas ginsengisoli Gsoil 348 TaxID=661478 RepID=A0A068NNA5_FIMGI|nr:peptide-methionine (S)-S-oxide reductase MsrA [Fimbriimonas ginsengisoli]AIE84230.1 peptide methionine sulfoxide reductase msrA [Fimbriimonas ginsengisoli Gsoil 348]